MTTNKNELKERPILFSGPMVRAIIEGRKIQTRRVYQPTHIARGCRTLRWENQSAEELMRVGICPYGLVGDRLWVRERWAEVMRCGCPKGGFGGVIYHADEVVRHSIEEVNGGDRYRTEPCPAHAPVMVGRWRPSIHMPRWASRILVDVVSIRAERVQDISEEDAIAEGIDAVANRVHTFPIAEDPRPLTVRQRLYAMLWNSINGTTNPWASNPWVWVVEFARVGQEGAGRAASPSGMGEPASIARAIGSSAGGAGGGV